MAGDKLAKEQGPQTQRSSVPEPTAPATAPVVPAPSFPQVGDFAELDGKSLCVVLKVSDTSVVQCQDASIVEAVEGSRLEPRAKRTTPPGDAGSTQWERFEKALGESIKRAEAEAKAKEAAKA